MKRPTVCHNFNFQSRKVDLHWKLKLWHTIGCFISFHWHKQASIQSRCSLYHPGRFRRIGETNFLVSCDPMVFPDQTRDIVSPASPGSFPGSTPSWRQGVFSWCLNHLMVPLDVEEQQSSVAFCRELISVAFGLVPLLSPRSLWLKVRNVDRVVNKDLLLAAQLPLRNLHQFD